ncbi:MAG: small-conductance mechanosensitive channel, partial [Actinobacteria bacterium]|nr:small-conductance mechanosensitive channel [Actinomycetota bacterium]
MNLNLDLKEVANWFLGAPIRVLVILILSLILQKVASRAITRALSKVAEADFIPGEKTHV